MCNNHCKPQGRGHALTQACNHAHLLTLVPELVNITTDTLTWSFSMRGPPQPCSSPSPHTCHRATWFPTHKPGCSLHLYILPDIGLQATRRMRRRSRPWARLKLLPAPTVGTLLFCTPGKARSLPLTCRLLHRPAAAATAGAAIVDAVACRRCRLLALNSCGPPATGCNRLHHSLGNIRLAAQANLAQQPGV